MKNKNIGTKNIVWDLSFLYLGIDDLLIDLDVQKLVRLKKEFNLRYKGKLSQKLGSAIADCLHMEMLEAKIDVYLSLRQAVNVSDAVVKAKIADVERILNQASGEYMAFFGIELVALKDAVLEKFYASDSLVEKHRPWIEHLRIYRPHFLSEPVEAALTKRSAFMAGAWSDFYDEVESDLRFPFKGEEKTLTEMLHILTDSRDREERALALQLVNDGFKGSFAKYSAQTLHVVVGSMAVETKERGYKNPMDLRNKSNRISDVVVEALHNAVRDIGVPLIQRYYHLKAAHLGVKTLKWSDRNAPMPFSDTEVIPYDEGLKTVLEAYESFSPTLAEIVHGFAAFKRIDAFPSKTKRGGAFNSSCVLPNSIPVSFTFLSYLGSNRDVMTLAHELGHGGHGMLAGAAQGPLMSQAPIAFCETASVFGEMTTFNFLKKRIAKKGDDKMLLALIMGKIDDVMNTVVRQIAFSNFERRIHGIDALYREWNDPKKLSVEELNAIWLEVTKMFYGEEGDIFTYENMDHLWSYVHHFHSPFYVYGYAFGELLTHSLYAKRPSLGDRFEPLYLELLRSGGTKNAVELLEPFGLDPTNEKFWVDGLSISMGAMIDEAERLSRAVGVSF